MTSVLYASLSAFLLGWLALTIIKLRRRFRVSIGDGDHKELKGAIAAHANAVENIPIALILLFALELNNAPLTVIHLLGLSLIIGRTIHAKAMLTANLRRRVFGMQITFYTIMILSFVNLIYLPYSEIFNL